MSVRKIPKKQCSEVELSCHLEKIELTAPWRSLCLARKTLAYCLVTQRPTNHVKHLNIIFLSYMDSFSVSFKYDFEMFGYSGLTQSFGG